MLPGGTLFGGSRTGILFAVQLLVAGSFDRSGPGPEVGPPALASPPAGRNLKRLEAPRLLPGCMNDTLSAAEAAVLLHLNVKRVQALARAGQLPATRVGRKWLFPRSRIERMVGVVPAPATATVELSARNQLRGRILMIHGDGIMAEVRLDIGGQELIAVITKSSADRLRLSAGDEVLAVIKSTEVMIGRK